MNLGDLAADGNWSVTTGWRLMFGSEMVPAGLFTLLILLVPETPRYLAMSGQEEKALTVLSNINGESKAREILNDIKNTVIEKKEKLLAYGALVIFVGIMLSVFQQFVGINAVLYFAPRIFESMGMGNPMTQTVLMGVINITFTLVAIFTVEKLGRKPLLITGSLGMALGALGVALANVLGVPGHRPGRERDGLQRFVYVLLGPHLLGAHLRDLPQHHPRSRSGHRRGVPVDLQLHRELHLRAAVHLEPGFHLRHVLLLLPPRGVLRVEAGSGNQGQDPGRHDRPLARTEVVPAVLQK